MNTICSQLSSLKKDIQTKKEHVRKIKQMKNNMTQKTKENICPKCGSELIVRKGKYGNFKGCSGYPRCRYTAS
jgi:ssDNA-binding Zn-finger/Zn-ribbon topoisomerase 1